MTDQSGLSGIELLRTLMVSDRRPPMVALLDLRLVEVDDGRVVFEGTPGRSVYNPIGSVHGGYAATLLDSACGCSVQSKLAATQSYTTLELKLAYHRALTEKSGIVRAEGRVMTIGRRVAFASAELFDEQGRLCVSATSTLLVFDLPAPQVG